jgi:hypothetical protein
VLVVNCGRADAWKRAFRGNYEVQYATCVKHQLESAPEQIHNVMNIVANVKTLRPWTKSDYADTRKEIVDKGTRIIRQWILADGLFENDSDSLALHHQVQIY